MSGPSALDLDYIEKGMELTEGFRLYTNPGFTRTDTLRTLGMNYAMPGALVVIAEQRRSRKFLAGRPRELLEFFAEYNPNLMQGTPRLAIREMFKWGEDEVRGVIRAARALIWDSTGLHIGLSGTGVLAVLTVEQEMARGDRSLKHNGVTAFERQEERARVLTYHGRQPVATLESKMVPLFAAEVVSPAPLLVLPPSARGEEKRGS